MWTEHVIRLIDSQMTKIILNYNVKGKRRAERTREKRIDFANNDRRKAGVRNLRIETNRRES